MQNLFDVQKSCTCVSMHGYPRESLRSDEWYLYTKTDIILAKVLNELRSTKSYKSTSNEYYLSARITYLIYLIYLEIPFSSPNSSDLVLSDKIIFKWRSFCFRGYKYFMHEHFLAFFFPILVNNFNFSMMHWMRLT